MRIRNHFLVIVLFFTVIIMPGCMYEITKIQKPRRHFTYFDWEKDRRKKRLRTTYRIQKKPNLEKTNPPPVPKTETIPIQTPSTGIPDSLKL